MTRSYCGLYIDAGYLAHSAATRLTGSSYRGGITVDHAQLITGLTKLATTHSGLPLLRVNWYDGADGRGDTPSDTQRQIGRLPHVKIRLGRRTSTGEQKGVDSRICLDLATHARMSNVDVIYLLSGDDDLTEAVEEAQSHGAQVVILAIPTKAGAAHGLSEHLEREADEIIIVDPSLLDLCISVATKPSPAATAKPAPPKARASRASRADATPTHLVSAGTVYSATTGEQPLVAPDVRIDPVSQDEIDAVSRTVVLSWMASSSPKDRQELRESRPNIPPDLDRALLVDLSDRARVWDLDYQTRTKLRASFWAEFDTASRERS